MPYLRTSLVALALVLMSSAAFAADTGAPEAPSTTLEAPAKVEASTTAEPAPCEVPEWGGDSSSAYCAGCSLSLANSGVGSNCSCSATGRGATCTRNANQGGNTVTITCTDATGTVSCGYTNNGSSCGCA